MMGYLVHPADQAASFRPSSSSTRTAASTRISGMSRGAWRWKALWRLRRTTCRRSAARLPTRRRRASMFGELDPAQTVANGVATVEFLKGHELGTGKVGAMGFCWGGGTVNNLAIAAPDLAAGVAYYGAQPKDRGRSPRSRRRCFCNMQVRTSGSTPASTPTRLRSRRPARISPSTSTRARSMPSTTTPRPRATTRKPPTSPGAGR